VGCGGRELISRDRAGTAVTSSVPGDRPAAFASESELCNFLSDPPKGQHGLRSHKPPPLGAGDHSRDRGAQGNGVAPWPLTIAPTMRGGDGRWRQRKRVSVTPQGERINNRGARPKTSCAAAGETGVTNAAQDRRLRDSQGRGQRRSSGPHVRAPRPGPTSGPHVRGAPRPGSSRRSGGASAAEKERARPHSFLGGRSPALSINPASPEPAAPTKECIDGF
jgi:hypothetical protein